MPVDKELIGFLDSDWVSLGFGVVFTAIGFAIILMDWKQFFSHPMLSRGKVLPVVLASYFLGFGGWTWRAFDYGHLIVAWGLTIIGIFQLLALLVKLQIYHRAGLTKQ